MVTIDKDFLGFLSKVDPAGLRDESFLLKAGGSFIFNKDRSCISAVAPCLLASRFVHR